MAVKPPGDTGGTTGVIPQVVPSGGRFTTTVKDPPKPASVSRGDRTKTARVKAVPKNGDDSGRSRGVSGRREGLTPIEAGTVPVTSVTDAEFRRLVAGFVAGEIDGAVLGRTGRAGTTQVTLRPGRQVQENEFQVLLRQLGERQQAVEDSKRALRPRERVRGKELRTGRNSFVVRTFVAIANGFSGRTEGKQRQALADEKALRPAVAAGLKKRMSRSDYIRQLSDLRWYDILRSEVPKPQFAKIWEKNERFPFQVARDDGAVEILSTVVPVAWVFRGTFKAVTLVGTGAGRKTTAAAIRRFIADETGSIGKPLGRVRPGASITEEQQSNTIRALVRAIDRARAEGASQARLDKLYATLRAFQTNRVPIRQTTPSGGPAARPDAAPPQGRGVQVVERPVVVKNQAVLDAERLLSQTTGKVKAPPKSKPDAAPPQGRGVAQQKPKEKPKQTEVQRVSRRQEEQAKESAEAARSPEAPSKRQERLQRQADEKAKQRRTKLKEELQTKPQTITKPKATTVSRARPATRTKLAPSTRPASKTEAQPITKTELETKTESATKTETLKATAFEQAKAGERLRVRRSTRKKGPKGRRGDEDPTDKGSFDFKLPSGRFARKVVFRLGAFWVTQTLDGSEPIFSTTRPPQARRGKTPMETHKVIETSSRPPTQKILNQGNTRIRISGGGVRFQGI